MSEDKPRKKAAKKRKSSHPGVVLMAPRPPRTSWRMRFRDPDSGKMKWERIEATTEEGRLRAARHKSNQIKRRRIALEEGAVRKTEQGLAETVESYFTTAGVGRRESTVVRYRIAAAKLTTWCDREGIKGADDLTRERLGRFHDWLVTEKVNGRPKSLHTTHGEIAALRAILSKLRKKGRFASLSHEDVVEALEQVRPHALELSYLGADERVKLLEAAIAHDLDTQRILDGEHLKVNRGEEPHDPTLRHDVFAAPLVLTALLSGMRLAELVGVTWNDVRLDTKGEDGAAVGEIRIRAEVSKTHKARSIALDVSPSLRELLGAMKPRNETRKALSAPVFGVSYDEAKAVARRLRRYGAPSTFTWKLCRRTCGTFLVNAPAIYEAASASKSARRLGHSVAVAERHYVHDVHGIPRDARTLEQAMDLEALAARIVDTVKARSGGRGVAPVLDLDARRRAATA